ncbi:MAG TPA: YHS domain-containing (seleno)protein [Puia sp.]|nr:YHS domain-containing (seleno)protein [Puia sp.]
MKRVLNLVSLIFFLTVGASAQSMSSNGPHCNIDASGLAIEGYDPVAYFTSGNAVEGSKEYVYTVDGATYRFVSAQNRDLFKAAPSKYRPQYGGWCAYAMGAKGEKVEIDPKTFKVLNGKLYLFYNKYFNNTLKSWNKDEANLKMKADANWMRQNTK